MEGDALVPNATVAVKVADIVSSARRDRSRSGQVPPHRTSEEKLKWVVEAWLLDTMKQLRPGILTAFRLLRPMGDAPSMSGPTVLPESLLELLPPQPPLSALSGLDPISSEALTLISATERLMRRLHSKTAGLEGTKRRLGELRAQLNGQPFLIAGFMLCEQRHAFQCCFCCDCLPSHSIRRVL
eukprot:SAG11_NODE_4039_length_2093_cov_1.322969_1_plen_184_part_00